jgi:hypothetical protein
MTIYPEPSAAKQRQEIPEKVTRRQHCAGQLSNAPDSHSFWQVFLALLVVRCREHQLYFATLLSSGPPGPRDSINHGLASHPVVAEWSRSFRRTPPTLRPTAAATWRIGDSLEARRRQLGPRPPSARLSTAMDNRGTTHDGNALERSRSALDFNAAREVHASLSAFFCEAVHLHRRTTGYTPERKRFERRIKTQ